jgi:hypothetical protein
VKTTIVLEGAEQLQAKLTVLPEKVQRRAVRESVRSAMQIYLGAAKRNAQGLVEGKMGALLASALYLKASKRTRKAYYGMLCLFHTGRQQSGGLVWTSKKGKRSFIPAAIEYGHGRHKAQAALPFMRQSFDQTKNPMLATLSSELGTKIEEAAK